MRVLGIIGSFPMNDYLLLVTLLGRKRSQFLLRIPYGVNDLISSFVGIDWGLVEQWASSCARCT